MSNSRKSQKHHLQKQHVQSGKRRRLVTPGNISGVPQSSDGEVERRQDVAARMSSKSSKGGRPTLITFDLETTGLIQGSVMPHITQIAALDISTGERFSIYVKPKKLISKEAEDLTGISYSEETGMKVHENEVECVTIRSAIKKLCRWLKQLQNVYLVAHCGRTFDFPILMTAVRNINYNETFLETVAGFIDSHDVFRERFPGESLKLVDLAKRHLSLEYDAHNAEEDVKALEKLIGLCEKSEINKFRFSPDTV